jgi:hypothetical protein
MILNLMAAIEKEEPPSINPRVIEERVRASFAIISAGYQRSVLH